MALVARTSFHPISGVRYANVSSLDDLILRIKEFVNEVDENYNNCFQCNIVTFYKGRKTDTQDCQITIQMPKEKEPNWEELRTECALKNRMDGEEQIKRPLTFEDSVTNKRLKKTFSVSTTLPFDYGKSQAIFERISGAIEEKHGCTIL